MDHKIPFSSDIKIDEGAVATNVAAEWLASHVLITTALKLSLDIIALLESGARSWTPKSLTPDHNTGRRMNGLFSVIKSNFLRIISKLLVWLKFLRCVKSISCFEIVSTRDRHSSVHLLDGMQGACHVRTEVFERKCRIIKCDWIRFLKWGLYGCEVTIGLNWSRVCQVNHAIDVTYTHRIPTGNNFIARHLRPSNWSQRFNELLVVASSTWHWS